MTQQTTPTKHSVGIPQGNTVVIVGDPGTGKTTFLLSFFRHVEVQNKKIILSTDVQQGQQSVGDAEKSETQPERKRESYTCLNNLFQTKDNLPDETKKGILRIFISLESSFERMLANNNALLTFAEGSTAQSNDFFVFVDASGLLSGRLEDKLRYPSLNHGPKTPDYSPWKQFNFSLKACDEKDADNRCLFWDGKHKGKDISKRIDQLNHEYDPFNKKIKDPRLFVLGTPSVPDVSLRIRIFKDLLAALFAAFNDDYTPLLTIDSLSALITPFDGPSNPCKPTINAPSPPSARRLNMLNLIRWFEERQATTFMSCEAKRTDQATLRGQPLFLGEEERYLASGVIQLDYHRYKSGDIVRFLRILKMRGTAHDMRAYAYDLNASGIEWLELLFGDAGQGDNYA